MHTGAFSMMALQINHARSKMDILRIISKGTWPLRSRNIKFSKRLHCVVSITAAAATTAEQQQHKMHTFNQSHWHITNSDY